MNKNLPAYLLNWEFISNVIIHLHDTRTSSQIHTVRTKHEFAKKMSEMWLMSLSSLLLGGHVECIGSAVECRTHDRETTVTSPLHMMAPLMATSCGNDKTKYLYLAINCDLHLHSSVS